jgi:hypothetical protein
MFYPSDDRYFIFFTYRGRCLPISPGAGPLEALYNGHLGSAFRAHKSRTTNIRKDNWEQNIVAYAVRALVKIFVKP